MPQNRKSDSLHEQQTATTINIAIDDVIVTVYCILNKVRSFLIFAPKMH